MPRLFVVAAAAALVVAPAAAAKFAVRLNVPAHVRVRQPVAVVVRTGDIGGGACRMRVVAIAPGADERKALAALVDGSIGVMTSTGLVVRRLRVTPAIGLRVALRRTGATAWRGTTRFPRAGRWKLVVPNWCAPGYATPSPAVRVVVVR